MTIAEAELGALKVKLAEEQAACDALKKQMGEPQPRGCASACMHAGFQQIAIMLQCSISMSISAPCHHLSSTAEVRLGLKSVAAVRKSSRARCGSAPTSRMLTRCRQAGGAPARATACAVPRPRGQLKLACACWLQAVDELLLREADRVGERYSLAKVLHTCQVRGASVLHCPVQICLQCAFQLGTHLHAGTVGANLPLLLPAGGPCCLCEALAPAACLPWLAGAHEGGGCYQPGARHPHPLRRHHARECGGDALSPSSSSTVPCWSC